MGDVHLVDFEDRPARPSPLVAERRGVFNFRGPSLHRDAGCSRPDSGRDDYGRCCPACDWGAFVCRHCGSAEGEVPTDCPRREMTEAERSAVHSGDADYVVAAGGWVKCATVARPRTAGKFACVEAE